MPPTPAASPRPAEFSPDACLGCWHDTATGLAFEGPFGDTLAALEELGLTGDEAYAMARFAIAAFTGKPWQGGEDLIKLADPVKFTVRVCAPCAAARGWPEAGQIGGPLPVVDCRGFAAEPSEDYDLGYGAGILAAVDALIEDLSATGALAEVPTGDDGYFTVCTGCLLNEQHFHQLADLREFAAATGGEDACEQEPDAEPTDPPRPFGMFATEAERDAWVARRDAALDAEAVGLAHLGITDTGDLTAKYAALCDLFERAWHGLEITPEPGDISLTSDGARAAANRVLEIMNGGPWRGE